MTLSLDLRRLDRIDETGPTWQTCEESARIRAFCREEDRRRATLSLSLQKFVVARRFGIPPTEIVLKRTLHGKPYYENTAGFNFNVSHDGEYVVVASSDSHDVGVDLVHLRRPVHLPAYVAHLSDGERHYVGDSPERFLRIWSLKEAYTKAIGVGLHHPNLRDVAFEVTPTGTRLSGGDAWSFLTMMVNADHLLSVAMRKS